MIIKYYLIGTMSMLLFAFDNKDVLFDASLQLSSEPFQKDPSTVDDASSDGTYLDILQKLIDSESQGGTGKLTWRLMNYLPVEQSKEGSLSICPLFDLAVFNRKIVKYKWDKIRAGWAWKGTEIPGLIYGGSFKGEAFIEGKGRYELVYHQGGCTTFIGVGDACGFDEEVVKEYERGDTKIQIISFPVIQHYYIKLPSDLLNERLVINGEEEIKATLITAEQGSFWYPLDSYKYKLGVKAGYSFKLRLKTDLFDEIDKLEENKKEDRASSYYLIDGTLGRKNNIKVLLSVLFPVLAFFLLYIMKVEYGEKAFIRIAVYAAELFALWLVLPSINAVPFLNVLSLAAFVFFVIGIVLGEWLVRRKKNESVEKAMSVIGFK